MKPYLLAIHTTLFFALILVVVLIAAMLWLVHVAGHEIVADVAALRGYQGIDVVKELEARLGQQAEADLEEAQTLLEGETAKAFLDEQALTTGLRLRLRSKAALQEVRVKCLETGMVAVGAKLPAVIRKLKYISYLGPDG